MTAVEQIVDAEVVAEVTKPGVYEIDEADYHADPVPGGSLSSSGARKLLSPSCPAIFKWEQDHPTAPTKAFDLGHAAHKLVLGSGPALVEVEADDWRTKAAKERAIEVRAAGGVPLLTRDLAEVTAMADALRRHPVASALFNPASGQAEQSLFWEDDAAGIWRRARLDWLTSGTARLGQRLLIPDYKTAKSADPEEFVKSVANYGYHQQAAWYLDAVQALGLGGDDAAFLFVVQEKTAPYLVSVVQLDGLALSIGRFLNRRAIDTYAKCTRTGVWPGYVDDVALMSLPYWYEKKHEEAL